MIYFKKTGILLFIKMINFCSVRDSSEDERQVIDWVRIFANHMSEKGLISRIYLKNFKT